MAAFESATTMPATMTPRRLPVPPHLVTVRPSLLSEFESDVASAGWLRKTWALALHLACLWLFAAVVVWPLVSSVSSGELAREFKPVLQALQRLAAAAAAATR
jgi:thiosulfate reductase cytochrome b subunit